MNKISTNNLAYAAGIIDGEGCINITKTGRLFSYGIRILVVNTNRKIIDWLRNNFGGDIQKSTVVKKPNWKPRFTWRLQYRQAVEFLDSIFPYLILKKEQAIVAFALQAIKDKPKYAGFQKGYSKETKKAIELCIKQMKWLNKKGKLGQITRSPVDKIVEKLLNAGWHF